MSLRVTSAGGGGSNHNILSSTHSDSTVGTVVRGDLVTGQGATPTWNRLALGAANRLLRSNGTDSSWSQVTLTTDVTGTLPIANGGTNNSSVYTSGSVIFSDGTSLIQNNANLFWDNTNNRMGLGTESPTNILSMGGNLARTLWMERHSTANTAGNSLTVQSGGATSGATDKNGGDLILASATATGTGSSKIQLQTSKSGATGTADRAVATVVTVFGNGGVELGSGATTPGQSRLALKGGTALLASDIVLDAAWGANATVSVTGTDSRGKITVTTSNLDNPIANPILTLTFKDGTWTTVPFAVSNMDNSSTGPIVVNTAQTTATTLIISYQGIPPGFFSNTYIFNYIVIG